MPLVPSTEVGWWRAAWGLCSLSQDAPFDTAGMGRLIRDGIPVGPAFQRCPEGLLVLPPHDKGEMAVMPAEPTQAWVAHCLQLGSCGLPPREVRSLHRAGRTQLRLASGSPGGSGPRALSALTP